MPFNTSIFNKNRLYSDVRVAIFSDAMLERNGVGTYYHDLLEHLEDRIAGIQLICPGHQDEKFLSLGLSLPGDPTQKLCFPSFWAVLRAVRRLKPEIIVISTPGPYGWCGLFLARLLQITVCAAYHTRVGALVRIYWKGRLGNVAGNWVEKTEHLIFRLSGLVVGTSREMIQCARTAGIRKTRLVKTPIARSFFRIPIKPLPEQLGSVLFVGRLASEKNIEMVLESAEHLPQFHFCIAGDGPQKKDVEKAAARLDNLRYAGWVSRERVISLMDDHDMLILPSQVESFGTVAAEAMARERLVLVSPRCGILDWPLLAKGVVTMHEDETLAEAINRVAYMGRVERKDLAVKARQAVKKLNENAIGEWLDVFETLRSRR